MPYTPPAPVPDYMEPIIGFRYWRLTDDATRLQSRSTLWHPYQPFVAEHVEVHQPLPLRFHMASLAISYVQRGAEERIATVCRPLCRTLRWDSKTEAPIARSYIPGCGIYAFTTRERLQLEVGTPLSAFLAGRRPLSVFLAGGRLMMGPRIYGRVALWGEVVCHDHGYRAEVAYPLDFEHAIGLAPAQIQQLADAYGIPYSPEASWTLAASIDACT